MKFEESLAKLEGLVRRMESGDMDLDAMIKSFEEGKALADGCRKELESVRLKIDKAVGDSTEPVGVKPDGDIDL